MTNKKIEKAKNKCKYCNKIIGDFVSNYHIGCYYKEMERREKTFNNKKPDYEGAFNYLLDYWDYFPEDERNKISKELEKRFGV